MPNTVKILARFWIAYFIMTIALIGVVWSALIFFPLQFLSLIIPPLKGLHDKLLQKGIRFLLWVQPWLRARVEIDVPQASAKGVMLVSNHRSHLDVFILLSRIPGIRILAKSTLFRIPFLSLYMKGTRQIRVERGRLEAWIKAMDEVGRRLREGERVHIFPEMTRCKPGHQGLLPFTAGPFLVAMQEDVWVVPVVFRNTDGAWPKGFLGILPGAAIEAKTLAPLRAKEFQSADALKQEVHRRIEQALA